MSWISARSARGSLLSFKGDGIFFWWQAGAVTALSKLVDFSQVPCVGASAGALAASLAACECDMDAALECALSKSRRAGVFERGPWGLYGIWGGIIRSWLYELLPADAHHKCSGRVHIMMRECPSLQLRSVSDFSSLDDLISANLASVHVPLFIDGHLAARFRGHQYVDGSISLLNSNECDLLAGAVTIHSSLDPRMRRKYGVQDFLKLTTADSIREMMVWGAQHVEAMDAQGELDALRHKKRP